MGSGPPSLRHSLSGPRGKTPRPHPGGVTPPGTRRACTGRGENRRARSPWSLAPTLGPGAPTPRWGQRAYGARPDRGGGRPEGSRAGSPDSPTQGGRPALPCGLLGLGLTPGWTPLALLSSGGRPHPSHQHDPPHPDHSVSPPGSSSEHNGGRQPGLCTQRLQHAGQREDRLGPRPGGMLLESPAIAPAKTKASRPHPNRPNRSGFNPTYPIEAKEAKMQRSNTSLGKGPER